MPGSMRRSMPSMISLPRTRVKRPRFAASVLPARCTGRRCLATTVGRCARPFSGTTAAPMPNAPNSSGAVPRSHTITGNLAMPGFTAPKLLWVARHEPEVFARVAKVLLPKAYVRYRLTGEMVEDMSDAAGTLWLDVGQRRWSALVLHATGLDLHQMPRLVEGSEVSAVLAPEFARRWGMASDVAVAGGAGDSAASAIGLGAIAPGDAFLSLGTSGVLFRVTDRFAPAPASRCPRLLPRPSRPVAPDGRDVVGGSLAGLARGRDGDACIRAARPARRGCRPAEPGEVPALSRRRAHAAQRRRRGRRLHRPSCRDGTRRISFRRCSKASPLPRATISSRWALQAHRSVRSISSAAARARRSGRRSAPTCSAFPSTASRRARWARAWRGAARQACRHRRRPGKRVRASAPARDIRCRVRRRWPLTTKPITSGESSIPR